MPLSRLLYRIAEYLQRAAVSHNILVKEMFKLRKVPINRGPNVAYALAEETTPSYSESDRPDVEWKCLRTISASLESAKIERTVFTRSGWILVTSVVFGCNFN